MPQPMRSREIPSNHGQPLGHLDTMLPCLYLAHNGVRVRDLRQRNAVRPGVFSLGECTHDEPGRVAPHVGLILPLRLCRDQAIRARLGEIPAVINDPQSSPREKQRTVQSILDGAFGGDLRVDDREVFNGFLALLPEPSLFRRLCESFDYVTHLIDNPAGAVRITQTARFCWRSYGELMEWYHGVWGQSGTYDVWTPLTPFFVSGNIEQLASYHTERWARKGLHRPAEDPSKWFVIRPGLVDARIGVRLEMGVADWTKLHLTLDDDTTTAIRLSEVFDPFDELVAWGQAIGQGDLPVQMEIDGEGEETVMTVLPSDSPARVLLRVTRKYEDTILLEGVVSGTALASSLRTELRRFFMHEFDPQGWDFPPDELAISTKARVLGQAWLVGNPPSFGAIQK